MIFSFYGVKNIHYLRNYLIGAWFRCHIILRLWRDIISRGFIFVIFNWQRLNKGIKFNDLRILNFILFFKMTPNLFLGYVEHASITVLLF